MEVILWYTLNSQSRTLYRTFSPLTKLVLEWELQVSLKVTIIEQYETKMNVNHIEKGCG
jgi:hypothetical protein